MRDPANPLAGGGERTRTFSDVAWSDTYVFWFDVPNRATAGRYSACVRATDAHGNSAQSCAPLVIR